MEAEIKASEAQAAAVAAAAAEGAAEFPGAGKPAQVVPYKPGTIYAPGA